MSKNKQQLVQMSGDGDNDWGNKMWRSGWSVAVAGTGILEICELLSKVILWAFRKRCLRYTPKQRPLASASTCRGCTKTSTGLLT